MTFDSQSFLNTETTGAMSTEYPVIDEGDYTVQIDKLDAKQVVSSKNGETYHFLDITYIVDDEAARAKTGMAQPRARQSIILDLTDDGRLDKTEGKNVALGRVRDAVGQNDPSRPWSFQMLIGQTCRGSIKHRVADDGRIFAEVKAVTKL